MPLFANHLQRLAVNPWTAGSLARGEIDNSIFVSVKQKHIHMRRIKNFPGMTFLAAVVFALLGMQQQAIGQGSSSSDFTRTYTWSYEGEEYGFSYRFPWKTYNFYQERPRVYSNYAVYTYEHPDQEFLKGFASALTREARSHGLSDWQTINYVIAFVQSLSYKREIGEYPKFPVETLADQGGDCEDSAILLAALLDRMGYDAVLVNPPRHMAVALACENCKGASYEKSGRQYFYIETTSTGFAIGDMPKEYIGQEVKLIRLQASPEELWVLRAEPGKTHHGTPAYYVVEEDNTEIEHAGETRIITTTTVRTLTINGKIYTTTTVTRRWE